MRTHIYLYEAKGQTIAPRGDHHHHTIIYYYYIVIDLYLRAANTTTIRYSVDNLVVLRILYRFMIFNNIYAYNFIIALNEKKKNKNHRCAYRVHL